MGTSAPKRVGIRAQATVVACKYSSPSFLDDLSVESHHARQSLLPQKPVERTGRTILDQAQFANEFRDVFWRKLTFAADDGQEVEAVFLFERAFIFIFEAKIFCVDHFSRSRI